MGFVRVTLFTMNQNPTPCYKKELVRHLVQSEAVWNWAVLNSSGSLSPRTKFSILSKLEISGSIVSARKFCLNILRRCRKRFDRFRSCRYAAHSSYKTATAYSSNALREIWYRQLFGKDPASIPEGWKFLTVGDVLNDTQYGLSDSLEAHGRYPVLE